MTPADRILKAAHQVIDRHSMALNVEPTDRLHQIVIRVKPRGDGWRASLTVETAEEVV